MTVWKETIMTKSKSVSRVEKQSQVDTKRILDKKGFASQLSKLSRDQEKRSDNEITPRVVTIGAHDEVKGTPPAGTVMLAFERKGTGFLAELESALTKQSVEELEQIHAKWEGEVKSRPSMSMTKAINTLIELPIYFEFGYAGKPLAIGVGLPDKVNFGTLIFPTNGGKLNSAEFQVRQYVKDSSSIPLEAEYDYLVVERETQLSDLERKVVAAVPSDQTRINISSGGPVAIWPAVVLQVAVMTVLGTLCLRIEEDLASVKLNQNQVDRLGEQASARELLAMRRDIFGKM